LRDECNQNRRIAYSTLTRTEFLANFKRYFKISSDSQQIDEARYEWEHEVKPTSVHTFGEKTIQKSPRYSIVFWQTTQVDPNSTSALDDILNNKPTDSRQRIRLHSSVPRNEIKF
jgi:hypothetical protein